MHNEKGNVIALVLLILSVVSLVGAGALLVSRYDLKFTSASKSYERNFNLADAAGDILFVYAERQLSEQKTDFVDPKNPPEPYIAKCHCSDSSECKNNANNCDPRTLDKRLGNFYSRAQLLDYTTQLQPGDEPGVGYEFWKGLGEATPPDKAAPTTSNNTATATVELALKKKTFGN